MEFFFTRIYDWLNKRKTWLYGLFAVTLAVFLFFSFRVRFEENIAAIIPQDNKTEKLGEVFENARFADRLFVMLHWKDRSKQDPDSLVLATDVLAAALDSAAHESLDKLQAKVDDDLTLSLFQILQDHLPVYLDEADYKHIDSLQDPERMHAALEEDIRLLSSPAGFALKPIIARDPSGISFLALKKLRQLQVESSISLYDNHFVTTDQQYALLFVSPSFPNTDTRKSQALLHILDQLIDKVREEFPGVQISYYGGLAVAAGNAAQLRRDTLYTQGLTVLFLVVFLALYFRKKRAPLLVLVPVVYGAAFALTCVYIIKGSISVIALGTGSIVLGIAINYSIHVFNHYRHVRNGRKTVADLAFPLTIGGLTTIGGFLSLQFAQSEMLRDLGLFAGCSLIGAAVCSLIFLPHFIRSKKEEAAPAGKHSWIDRLAGLRPEYNKWAVLAVLLLTVFFSFFVPRVAFEPDMTSLNYMRPELREAEKTLEQITGGSLRSVYVLSEAADLQGALQKQEQLGDTLNRIREENLIDSYAGVAGLFLSDSLQQLRIQRWEQYWAKGKRDQFLAALQQQGATLHFNATAFDPLRELMQTQFEPVPQQELAAIRQQYLDDYVVEQKGKTSLITIVHLPPANKSAVDKRLDRLPGVTVLDKQYLTSRLTQMVNTDFNKIAWITSGLVFFVLLLTFGRIELALATFIPMLISWIWILGIMALTGITFNIVNIIVSALIFGLGDDYSLFIMEGLLSEYKTGKKNLASYKSSIILSAITTVAGLGVLAFAKHPALRSIAFISVTGILSVVIMAQLLIPFFFRLLVLNRVKKNLFPWTLWSWSKSVFSFIYFALGSLFLTVAGWFLIKLNPWNKEKGKHIYHVLLSKLCWSVMYIMGNVRKKVFNPEQEDFSKPAVVIANHQSFLDILLTAMLNPRLILLTNKWVWNSPVFGAVVKMADFFPVAKGLENNIDQLAERVQKGYSVVVFPEGTRTSFGAMKRFHKGAFFLAEELKLDIVPVLLHGTGYTMTKGDYLLKDGQTSVRYLPRIEADDKRFGEGYAERTKKISRYVKKEYEDWKAELETPRFFAEQLHYNYLYKGPVLEWYARIKVKLEDYYSFYHQQFPRTGDFLDLGCGYGFAAYLLHWAAPGRRIRGVDYDEEKIATAANSFMREEGLKFLQADLRNFEIQDVYDGIILSDVLHYLDYPEQERLLERCIAALKPGGQLIIRDGDRELKEKHGGTRLSEWFSTRLFQFNKTTGKLHFIAGSEIEAIARKHNLHFQRVDETRYTSNLHFILKKNAAL